MEATANGNVPRLYSQHVMECFSESNACGCKKTKVGPLEGGFVSGTPSAFEFMQLGEGDPSSSSVRRTRDLPKAGRRGFSFSKLEQSARWKDPSSSHERSADKSDSGGSAGKGKLESGKASSGEGVMSASKSGGVESEPRLINGGFDRSVCCESSKGEVKSGPAAQEDRIIERMNVVPNKRHIYMTTGLRFCWRDNKWETHDMHKMLERLET